MCQCDVTSSFHVTPWRHVTSWCHTMMLCVPPLILCHVTVHTSAQVSWSEVPKITFSNLVTLTYDLDHRTHLRYHQGQSLHQILGPYVKRFRRERAEWQTHRQTDRRDRFYTLDRWRGREKHLYLVNLNESNDSAKLLLQSDYPEMSKRTGNIGNVTVTRGLCLAY